MFKSKVVIVTGSSSGIGARAAVKFAKEGAAVVVITGRRAELLEKVRQDAEAAGQGHRKIKAVVGDLTCEETQNQLINGTVKEYGRLDVLRLSECPISVFDNVFNVNLRSVVLLTQLAIPHSVNSKGNVINVSSIGALMAFPAMAYYCMSKTSLEHYTRCLAVELGPKGVRVNTLQSGSVPETDFTRGFDNENISKLRDPLEEKAALKRHGTSEEIANTMVFLASDQASFITGSTLTADGGGLVG